MIEKRNFSPIDGATIVVVMTDRNFVLNNPSPMYRLFVAKIFQLTETFIKTLKYFLSFNILILAKNSESKNNYLKMFYIHDIFPNISTSYPVAYGYVAFLVSLPPFSARLLLNRKN